MSGMFSGCGSLESLPDISKWNTSKVTDMSDMFEDCNSLISLPNMSK
jgi:surface protein